MDMTASLILIIVYVLLFVLVAITMASKEDGYTKDTKFKDTNLKDTNLNLKKGNDKYKK